MTLRQTLIAVLCTGALFSGAGASADELWTSADSWQGKIDVLTSGAAANVVMHHSCTGASASQAAAVASSQRLGEHSRSLSATYGEDVNVIWAYVQDSFGMKVKAMWAANDGVPCSGLGRLRSMAISTGFAAP
jgi:hypothetical protein